MSNRIYTYSTSTYKCLGWIKVGQTMQESARDRVDQQDGTSSPEPLIIEKEWLVPDSITDKKIHKKLRELGKKEVRLDKSREWFECSIYDVDCAINMLVNGVNRPNSYPPRTEQSDCVSKAVNHYREGGDEFLINAKMRYGKTFTSYLIAKEMQVKSVLVLTYKPAVNANWEEDLNTHTLFDGWSYSSGKGFTLNPDADVNVVFASFQDINNFNKGKWTGILNHKFDMLIVDEMHYGSETERAKFTMSNLQFDKALFVSGTPLDAIISGRFDESNTYTWSYADEQRKRKAEEDSKWATRDYLWLPPMEIHTFEVCAEAKKACLSYTDEEQFTMTKMFGSTDGAKFNDEATVKLFLDQVFGRGAVKKSHSPIRTHAADHMLWVLPPNVKSVKAMCNLLTQTVGNEYHIINVAGSSSKDGVVIKSLDKVKRRIKNYDKTITVTCGRFNTGVTVPEWDMVFMLNDGKAPETYFQTLFRIQSPDTNRYRAYDKKDEHIPLKDLPKDKRFPIKNKCVVVDFNPERTVEMVYSYAELTAKKSQSINTAVREFLEFAPIIDHSGNKPVVINTESVVSFITDSGNYIDKFTSSYLFDRNVASNFIELLALEDGISNVKSKKQVTANDLEKGKNYNNTGSKAPRVKSAKALEQEILEKAKLITAMIPEYVVLVDTNVDSVDKLLKTSRVDFEEHFAIKFTLFERMVNSKFLSEDRLNRLITGLVI